MMGFPTPMTHPYISAIPPSMPGDRHFSRPRGTGEGWFPPSPPPQVPYPVGKPRPRPPTAHMHQPIFGLTPLGAAVEYVGHTGMEPSKGGRKRQEKRKRTHTMAAESSEDQTDVDGSMSTDETPKKHRKKKRSVTLMVKDDQGRKKEVRATYRM